MDPRRNKWPWETTHKVRTMVAWSHIHSRLIANLWLTSSSTRKRCPWILTMCTGWAEVRQSRARTELMSFCLNLRRWSMRHRAGRRLSRRCEVHSLKKARWALQCLLTNTPSPLATRFTRDRWEVAKRDPRRTKTRTLQLLATVASSWGPKAIACELKKDAIKQASKWCFKEALRQTKDAKFELNDVWEPNPISKITYAQNLISYKRLDQFFIANLRFNSHLTYNYDSNMKLHNSILILCLIKIWFSFILYIFI